MPRMITVLINWLRNSALEKASLLKNVALGVGGHASVFINSPFKPEDLTKAADLLIDTFGTHLNGPNAKNDFDNAEKDVDDKLHDMAFYVTNIAKGDKTKIELSNFTASDPTSHPATVPDIPSIKSLTPQDGAKIKIIIDHVAGSQGAVSVIGEDHDPEVTVHTHHITIAPNVAGKVHVITHGKDSETISLSPTCNKVYVKTLCQNAAGMSAFSPVVSKKALE